jgi:hypothetical protein
MLYACLFCRTVASNDNAGEGVTGLKELGARELSYKLMFLACSATVSTV